MGKARTRKMSAAILAMLAIAGMMMTGCVPQKSANTQNSQESAREFTPEEILENAQIME